MKKTFFIITLALLLPAVSIGAETEKFSRETIFQSSPRLKYLEKLLLSRLSTHKIVQKSKKKITNDILFRDDLFFQLDELKTQKVKFSLLKELSKIVNTIRLKEEQIRLLKSREKEYSSRLDSFKQDIAQDATLWLKKEKLQQENEIEKLNGEKNLSLEILKEKTGILKPQRLREIIENPPDFFEDIKPGFETRIVEKKLELLAWEKRHFGEFNKKYPRFVYSLRISSLLPYVFFSLPLGRRQAAEIDKLITGIKSIALKKEKLENLYKKERLTLALYYALKQRQGRKIILEKLGEVYPLCSSFEDFATLKELYLSTALSLEKISLRIASLRDDLIAFGEPLAKQEPSPALFIPDLSQLIKYARVNSLGLQSRREELQLIQKLSALNHGTIRDYLLSLRQYRKLLSEKESSLLTQEVVKHWYKLVLAKERWEKQKEIKKLAEKDYLLSLKSDLKTPLEKKLKEIERLNQDSECLAKEEEAALNFLKLKESLKRIAPKEDLALTFQEVNPGSYLDLKTRLDNLFPPNSPLPEREKNARENLIRKELLLLEKKLGRIVISDKESLLAGKIESPFSIQISRERPRDVYSPRNLSAAKDFFPLKENLFREQEEKEKEISARLLRETQERLKELRERISQEEKLLAEFKKGLYIDSRQRSLLQEKRLLNKKIELLESMGDYIEDFFSLKGISKIQLNTAREIRLLKPLQPILTPQRVELLKLKKTEAVSLEQTDIYLSLAQLKEINKACLKALRDIKKITKTFSLKMSIGLISPEDLSELRLLEDKLRRELFLNKREELSLEKRRMPLWQKPVFELSAVEKIREKYTPASIETAVKNSPSIRIIDLELSKFASPVEHEFLSYLRKEKELKLKEFIRSSLTNFAEGEKIVKILAEESQTAESEFLSGLKGLKQSQLWLYGAYGFNSIFLKYVDVRKELKQVSSKFNFHTARLLQLLRISERSRKFNYQSILPANIGTYLQKLFAYIKENFPYHPLLEKERAARRETYREKNYRQKLHALNFYLQEKKKAVLLKEKKELFDLARKKEFEMEGYLDRLWEKEKEFRKTLKEKIKTGGIDIAEQTSSLANILGLNEKDKEVLELFFIQYARRFGKEKGMRSYIKNIGSLAEIFQKNAAKFDNLAPWWARYTTSILSYPEKSYLEDAIDSRLLGLYLYYVQLMDYLGAEGRESFLLRIKRDKEFLFLQPEEITRDKIESYFLWESEIKKELSRLTFSYWPKESWQAKRKKLVKKARGILGSLYGSFKDRTLQEEVLLWCISSGIEEKDYPEIFRLMEKVYLGIKDSFLFAKQEGEIGPYAALRLKWLSSRQAKQLLKEEREKLFLANIWGKILSWSDFFWKNKIGLNEIGTFFSFMQRLNKETLFTDIFGRYNELTPSQKRFYLSSLTYWAQRWLNEFRKEKDPLRAEENFKEKLGRFGFIYSLGSFQKIYGPLNLSRVNLKDKKEKKRLKEFTGKIGFFADWTENFSMDEEKTRIFFDDLVSLASLKSELEHLYSNQGVNLKLIFHDDRYREESMGIITSWLQFFQYRGLQGKAMFSQALKEMSSIQKEAKECNLKLSIDEIRYWWEKAKLKGHKLDTLGKLFKNISLVKGLRFQSSRYLINRINSSKLPLWETEPIKKEFIKFIKTKARTPLERTEVNNISERIMPVFNIGFGELKKEYAEKIYLEAAYFVFQKESPSPKKITQLHTIMKNRGYSLNEMGNFIRLYSLFRQCSGLRGANASDLEVFGLLNNIFIQAPPYGKKLRAWLNTASLLEGYFYKGHGDFLDFSLLKTLVGYSMLRMRPWQIRLLVEKGALSKNSADREIRKLNAYLSFKRFILRLFWENTGRTLSEKEVLKYYALYRKLNMPHREKMALFKKLSEKLSLLSEQLTILIGEILYEENLPAGEILSTAKRICEDIKSQIFPYLLRYLSSDNERVFRERRKKFLLEKRKIPYLGKKTASFAFRQRKAIEKSLLRQAKQIYGIELSPHKASSLSWKVFEGLQPEEALKVYLGDSRKIEKLYKACFLKKEIDFNDAELIQYFAEEINFSLLNEGLLKELFSLSAVIKTSFKEILGREISIREAVDYAWPGLYSGATKEIIGEIFLQAEIIQKNIKPLLPRTSLPSEGQTSFAHDKLLKDILYLLSQTYGIQLVEKLTFPYTLKTCRRAIEEGIDYPERKAKASNSVRKINRKGLKTAADNLKTSLQPPVTFLITADRADYIYNFIKENTHREASKKEILSYLDFINRENLNYLNLSKLFYGLPFSSINKKNLEYLIDISFKNFLQRNLRSPEKTMK